MNANPFTNSQLGYQIGLIGFTRLSNILRLTHYAIGIHPRYALRLLLISITSICTLPLRLWEKIVWEQRIINTTIAHPPIFIIGHWRSGTTHLHNLIAQDPAFGYLSMYQSMVPDCSLVGGIWLKSLLSKIVPLKRPMDNMTWPIDSPQEEEIPLAKTMPHSFYTQFLFPHRTLNLFKQFVLLQGASESFIREFKRKYYRLLQIATIHAHGKQLVLKNPVNTARIRLLLELFPGAKFIHIHRCPYDVFASTRSLRHSLLSLTTLQSIDPTNVDRTILELYEDMMQQFFRDRPSIPSGQIVEVSFADLERDPLQVLQLVYKELGLPGFNEALPAFASYISSQRAYQKNQFQLSAQERELIDRRWAFAFQKLGYANTLGEQI
ncbi:sulfotransferase family protein [Pseudanabaena sp. PCC 6802]|uniref:sulfotransferase family protein n=1 Tax=Pseudanabaena sp. PCC 6802 TaxID=118173 RepID=UPI0003453D9F|nr:sulfotransferase [Pseudanabaena sp. PCC 6802]